MTQFKNNEQAGGQSFACVSSFQHLLNRSLKNNLQLCWTAGTRAGGTRAVGAGGGPPREEPLKDPLGAEEASFPSAALRALGRKSIRSGLLGAPGATP